MRPTPHLCRLCHTRTPTALQDWEGARVRRSTVSVSDRFADETADAALRAESVSMAMLVILETLTPLERAVFVLHEVFGYAHTEIADVLDRRPAAVRQLAHRARAHVLARRPRYQADPRLQRQVTE